MKRRGCYGVREANLRGDCRIGRRQRGWHGGGSLHGARAKAQCAPQNRSANPPTTDQRGTDQQPITGKIQAAPQDKQASEKDEKERQDKAKIDKKVADETQRTADYTGWLALFTLLLFGTAILQAALFVWQLLYMRRSIEDAEVAATAAMTAANAAKEQVEVAKAQIEVTKIGIFDLERAYLDVGPSEITTSFVTDPPPVSGFFKLGDPMEVIIKINMTNTGRTRAAIVRAYGEFSQATLGEQRSYKLRNGCQYGRKSEL